MDFSDFYENLPLPNLNIEGAVQVGSNFIFLHRGNSLNSQNALIVCESKQVRAQIEKGQLTRGLKARVVAVSLGHLQGSPLSFTDASFYSPDRILFLASAEQTDNSYDDGLF